jgi:hypothetical protein
MRRRTAALVIAVMAVGIVPAVASAQPPIDPTAAFPIDCSDGSHHLVNFGPPKNVGTALHLVGENSILTSNGYEYIIDEGTPDEVDYVFKPRGLPAVDHHAGGVVCDIVESYEDATGTHTMTTRITGWITPRG